ncbi:MAG: IclR family transcriptional regulator [Actinomycetes bacterium]
MPAPRGSQAVDRAATLLALVVESDAPRTFTSLVEEVGLAKSTTSRLLQALERNRLVQRDRDGSFRAGSLFTAYATRHDAVHDLVEAARPALERLAVATGETVNLAVPRAGAAMQVAQIDSHHLLGTTNWVGVDVPAHCSALGKVFLAYGALPPPDGSLERYTPATRARPSELEADLAEVRRTGWAVSWEELELGLTSVAAPVRARPGRVVAAVSVAGPTARISRADLPRLGRAVRAEARALSTLLGHDPGDERDHQRDGEPDRHGKEIAGHDRTGEEGVA